MGRQQKCHHRPRLTDQLQKYFDILPAVYCFQMTHYRGLLSLCVFLLSYHETGETGPTWVLHLVVPLLSQASLSAWSWVQGRQRRNTTKHLGSCVLQTQKEVERREQGTCGVSGQTHLSPLPRLPDLHKSNCVISQRR